MGSKQILEPWSKGKLIGQKPPLKSGEVWAIPVIPIRTDTAHAARVQSRLQCRRRG
jgi:hypothetical protein